MISFRFTVTKPNISALRIAALHSESIVARLALATGVGEQAIGRFDEFGKCRWAGCFADGLGRCGGLGQLGGRFLGSASPSLVSPLSSGCFVVVTCPPHSWIIRHYSNGVNDEAKAFFYTLPCTSGRQRTLETKGTRAANGPTMELYTLGRQPLPPTWHRDCCNVVLILVRTSLPSLERFTQSFFQCGLELTNRSDQQLLPIIPGVHHTNLATSSLGVIFGTTDGQSSPETYARRT